MRNSRTRLRPWGFDGKPLFRPWVLDSRWRQPVRSDLRHAFPRQPVLLAASPERAPPKISDVMSECPECPGIRAHRVVREVPRDHRPQPSPLFGNGVGHAFTQSRLDLLESCPHRVAPRRDLPQMKMKPRKVKVSGLPNPRRFLLGAAKRPTSSSRVLSS